MSAASPRDSRYEQPLKALKKPSLIPFPAMRQRAFIVKHALRIAQLSPAQSEAYLRRILHFQRQAMRRRGNSETIIARELKRLEGAFRAELWRQILTPGGAS